MPRRHRCRKRADDCLQTRIAVLEERDRNRDRALALQAAEYERRLQDLNHAHARATEKNAEYLPREIFEASVKENLEWRRGVDNKLSSASGSRTAFLAVLSLVLALGSVGATVFLR